MIHFLTSAWRKWDLDLDSLRQDLLREEREDVEEEGRDSTELKFKIVYKECSKYIIIYICSQYGLHVF